MASDSYLALARREGVQAHQFELMSIAECLVLNTIKDAERLLELSLTADVRKQDGAVYTPDFIIDFLLEQTIANLENHDASLATFLDPACGSGGFLVGALKQLKLGAETDYVEISKRLRGLDRNAEAIENSRLLLDLFCLTEDGELSQAQFEVCDTLVTPVWQQLELIGMPQGVSLLATNPPYVKLQNLDSDYRKELIRSFPDFASGAFSLATLFLANASRYLDDGGSAGFITLNNLFTSHSGEALRNTWSNNRQVRQVIDFRHFTVFDASAYTCLIFLDKKDREYLLFNALNEQPNANSLRELEPFQVHYETLKPEKWRLGSPRQLKVIHALESKGVMLSEVTEIKVGVATLFDKAFVCQLIDRNYVAVGGDGLQRVIEPEVVQPFTKISELGEFDSVDTKQRGIIYPYDKNQESRPLLTIESFLETTPVAYEHLWTWRSRLLARSGINSLNWHEWGRRQSMIAPGPKLLTKTFDRRPSFHLDVSDGLFSNGYSIKPRIGISEYSINQLKAFLESRFMFAYALMTSFEIKGGFQCYQKNFIEKVCLPPATLLPANVKQRIEPKSKEEVEICQFYGITLSDLEDCLQSYLTEASDAA